MYSKLNINDIINGHYSTVSEQNKFRYKFEFVFLPLLLSFVLIIIKVPDNDVKNIFGICLSILTGLYLNILILLISSISSENLKIAIKHKKIRLDLLRETLYNVSFSVFTSVKALIALFFSSILFFKIDHLDDLLYILIEHDLNHLIQIFLGFFLYKYTIDIFLILFIILKRINSLYTKEIYVEELRLNNLEEDEINNN